MFVPGMSGSRSVLPYLSPRDIYLVYHITRWCDPLIAGAQDLQLVLKKFRNQNKTAVDISRLRSPDMGLIHTQNGCLLHNIGMIISKFDLRSEKLFFRQVNFTK